LNSKDTALLVEVPIVLDKVIFNSISKMMMVRDPQESIQGFELKKPWLSRNMASKIFSPRIWTQQLSLDGAVLGEF